jgi:hypothetical protein
MPVEALLESVPPPMREVAERLRVVVRQAQPDAIERVRTGWRLIAYDVPIGRRTRHFAWIYPEGHHVHLGFPVGSLMRDPGSRLEGAGITKLARWFTFVPGEPIDEPLLVRYLEEATRVVAMPRSLATALREGELEQAP